MSTDNTCEFKRGDKVLCGGAEGERIFLAFVPGSLNPYVTVTRGDESKFYANKKFMTTTWKYCTLAPKETTVKISKQLISRLKDNKCNFSALNELIDTVLEQADE